MTLPTIAPDARLYLRPVQLVDTPVGVDGQVARLAGGMQWFATYELLVPASGVRAVVAVADLPRLLEHVSSGQADRLQTLHARITSPRAPIACRERMLRLDQPLVAGILNCTPDSFSDGGQNGTDAEALAGTGHRMAEAGATLIDVGGESTRPGAATVWEGDEIARVVPVIERLVASGTPVSIDTRKAAVMEAALAAGAHIVNDVAALLFDPRALEVVARAGCPVVLMHSPDPESGGHARPAYAHVLSDVFDWLERRIEAVVAGGVDRARILVDPGIGFGKSLAENLALLNGLAIFHGLGCPILLGASRKRLIGALANEAPADQRLGGSLALALKGADMGAQLIRVHDVPETVQALRVWRGLRDTALAG
jgi:dihydropteroate synthase